MRPEFRSVARAERLELAPEEFDQREIDAAGPGAFARVLAGCDGGGGGEDVEFRPGYCLAVRRGRGGEDAFEVACCGVVEESVGVAVDVGGEEGGGVACVVDGGVEGVGEPVESEW